MSTDRKQVVTIVFGLFIMGVTFVAKFFVGNAIVSFIKGLFS
ncbi:hypothetical protein [Metabacillus niabensis]|uniref:Uncharacterized protein n=1 Tax=Metabacillus niabensis TaxID=324854 RepID=A0ABT9Z2Q1_9BACI|nr:hypothetical protein [Metabacillus niabensis]MDQ0226538.1 hypothetical protein [Metabacillus niabensis]